MRADLLQGLSVVVGVALGLWTPRLTAGPTVDSVSTANLLTGIAAGVLPFVGIVYSLLFLVVQFGSTNLTPRLNLFRDNPLVWRSFSYFVGLFVKVRWWPGYATGTATWAESMLPTASSG